MQHDKEVLPTSIAYALLRATKSMLLKWGLPQEAMICKAGGQGRCMYNHQDWNPELSKHTHTLRSKMTQAFLSNGRHWLLQAGRPKILFLFGQHFSREYSPPGHENPAMGFFWGVDHNYRCRSRKNNFFWRCSKK